MMLEGCVDALKSLRDKLTKLEAMIDDLVGGHAAATAAKPSRSTAPGKTKKTHRGGLDPSLKDAIIRLMKDGQARNIDEIRQAIGGPYSKADYRSAGVFMRHNYTRRDDGRWLLLVT